MNVLVTTEERFARTPDGQVWSGGSGTYSFWLRYLKVFDSVRVLARVAESQFPPEAWQRADGDKVVFCALPHFVGVKEQLRHINAIRKSVKNALDGSDAIILRAFSVIAPYVVNQLPSSRPFAVELAGDPLEVFGPFADPYPFRPLLRWWFTGQLKRQCKKACAVAYVTDHELRNRYPGAHHAFSTVYSSIELNDGAFASAPRHFSSSPRPLRIVSIGSMERLYKGFDTLIEAVALAKQQGLNISLRIVGEGRCRPELETLAQQRGLADGVNFSGRIPAGHAIRSELDNSDLFVLASKTEGLPRAMIEAMARALPCVGTAVGGIPELLPSSELVPRGDSFALAQKIIELSSDPERLNQASERNLAKARQYRSAVLCARRRQLYEFLREQTERWNLRQASQPSNYRNTFEVSRSNPSRS